MTTKTTTPPSTRDPKTQLPVFEQMLSHNIFIKNNHSLRDRGLLPDWVQWIQLGLPTEKQRRWRPDTAANFRMLSNAGRFLTCGHIEQSKENENIKVSSWSSQYIHKINTTVLQKGSPMILIGLTSVTMRILQTMAETICPEIQLTAYKWIHDKTKGQDTLGVRADHSIKDTLAYQAFFWKSEYGEDPPPLDAPLFKRKEITDAFAK